MRVWAVAAMRGRVYIPRLRKGFSLSGLPVRRSVAQPGSALVWGTRGRGFESRRSDHSRPERGKVVRSLGSHPDDWPGSSGRYFPARDLRAEQDRDRPLRLRRGGDKDGFATGDCHRNVIITSQKKPARFLTRNASGFYASSGRTIQTMRYLAGNAQITPAVM